MVLVMMMWAGCRTDDPIRPVYESDSVREEAVFATVASLDYGAVAAAYGSLDSLSYRLRTTTTERDDAGQILVAGEENRRSIYIRVKRTQPVAMLSQVMRSSRVPLILKEDLRLEESPEDARWSKEFDEAKVMALRGAWRMAAERFQQLAEKAPTSPAILPEYTYNTVPGIMPTDAVT